MPRYPTCSVVATVVATGPQPALRVARPCSRLGLEHRESRFGGTVLQCSRAALFGLPKQRRPILWYDAAASLAALALGRGQGC